jgi:hypothetical protein
VYANRQPNFRATVLSTFVLLGSPLDNMKHVKIHEEILVISLIPSHFGDSSWHRCSEIATRTNYHSYDLPLNLLLNIDLLPNFENCAAIDLSFSCPSVGSSASRASSS